METYFVNHDSIIDMSKMTQIVSVIESGLFFAANGLKRTDLWPMKCYA